MDYTLTKDVDMDKLRLEFISELEVDACSGDPRTEQTARKFLNLIRLFAGYVGK